VPFIDEITYFKESLSILLISVLFILLSANINMSELLLLWDWRPLTLFVLVIVMIRPLSVFFSTRQSTLSTKEKMFISWMGPRGIVAAGIASLFGLKLLKSGFPQAEYITPLVFMVVLGTVLLNATTARWVAKLLGVSIDAQNGILMIGASNPSRLIAKYLQDIGHHVVMLDSNRNHITFSEEMGLQAINANIYDDDLSDNLELSDVGTLMAMTGSAEVNQYALNNLAKSYGEEGAYRLITTKELKNPEQVGNNTLFTTHDDFINLSEVARDFPYIHEYAILNIEEFEVVISNIADDSESIPLLIKQATGKIKFILANEKITTVEANIGDTLVYMGKAYIAPVLDQEEVVID
jgi:Trk K+ transport system NAD-binding subunit